VGLGSDRGFGVWTSSVGQPSGRPRSLYVQRSRTREAAQEKPREAAQGTLRKTRPTSISRAGPRNTRELAQVGMATPRGFLRMAEQRCVSEMVMMADLDAAKSAAYPPSARLLSACWGAIR
jgi:hypothetical protein